MISLPADASGDAAGLMGMTLRAGSLGEFMAYPLR
jgi:hypothetical protein